MRKLGVGLCLAVLLLCGCGGKLDERDLVVRNESQTPLGSITITSDRESQCVTMGKDAPMEQGDSCAFDVDEGGQFRVETVADLFTAAVSFPLAGEGAPKA